MVDTRFAGGSTASSSLAFRFELLVWALDVPSAVGWGCAWWSVSRADAGEGSGLSTAAETRFAAGPRISASRVFRFRVSGLGCRCVDASGRGVLVDSSCDGASAPASLNTEPSPAAPSSTAETTLSCRGAGGWDCRSTLGRVDDGAAEGCLRTMPFALGAKIFPLFFNMVATTELTSYEEAGFYATESETW